jgi:hypothetical protein
MKPGLRIVAWTVFWATLLISLVVGAFAAWLLSEVLPAGTTITLENDRFVVPAFEHAGHYAIAVLVIWAVALVIVLVAPILIFLGLLLPALLGALGTVLVLALVGLTAWSAYRLLRRLWKHEAKASTMPP